MGVLTKDTDYFGLDIGDTGLRLVQLKQSGAKPVLVTYSALPLSESLLQSDSTVAVDQLATAIRQLCKEARVTTKNVVVGLPAAKIFASVITTPKLGQAELAKAIRFQADQYIPMAIDQVKLDYSVLGPGTSDKELEVLLVACPNTVAEKYLSVLEKAGLEVIALEANATAAYRALVPANSTPVIVLDVANRSTDLSIIYNNTPRLIRSIGVGGNTFVKSTASALGLDDVQADQFIKKFGMTESKLEGRVYKAIKPSVDMLVEEVGKSMKFFTTRYGEAKIEKVIMTGGTSAMIDLPVYLANALHLPIEIGNPWMNISYPSSLHEGLMDGVSGYAVACGLALRNLI